MLSCVRLCDPMDCSPPGSSVCKFPRQAYWSGLPFPTPGKYICIVSAYFSCPSHWWLWKLGKENHTSVRSGNHHQNFFIITTSSANLPMGKDFNTLRFSILLHFSEPFFFLNNVCLITKVIYVHLKIFLILNFLIHVWFEVKLENNCSFSNQNSWQLASKQSLELCNSPFSRKTFLKGPTPLLEPIISKQLLSRL